MTETGTQEMTRAGALIAETQRLLRTPRRRKPSFTNLANSTPLPRTPKPAESFTMSTTTATTAAFEWPGDSITLVTRNGQRTEQCDRSDPDARQRLDDLTARGQLKALGNSVYEDTDKPTAIAAARDAVAFDCWSDSGDEMLLTRRVGNSVITDSLDKRRPDHRQLVNREVAAGKLRRIGVNEYETV